MSQELVKELIAESRAEKSGPAVEIIDQTDEKDEQPNSSPCSPLSTAPETPDQQASKILSAPEPVAQLPPKAEPQGTSNVLKTRAQLIQKITDICLQRGTDPKKYNLKRRRKNSLQTILAEQFAEAVKQEMEPEPHPQLAGMLPEGLDSREKFCCSMAFRLDLTLCMLMEKGISATDHWHGLSADGFAKSIEDNETLASEIKSAWLEIIREPENEWILTAVSAPLKLALAHSYGLLSVIRRKEQKEDVVQKTVPAMETRRATHKLRDIVVRRATSRQEQPDQKPLRARTGGLVKSV